jgi:hypothetical protein
VSEFLIVVMLRQEQFKSNLIGSDIYECRLAIPGG